jgi:hypothetical protein
VAPPSNLEQKVAFVFVGGVGILALIGSTILNASSQNDLLQQVSGLRTDIQGLAKLSEVSPNAGTDQILAAAAAKLIEQDRKIRELQDRRLSPEQMAKMTAVARPLCPQFRKIPVTAANGNQEAQAFALDFVGVFKRAGCASNLELPIPGLTPDVQGIKIGVRSLESIPAEVGLLGKIFLAGGIQYQVNPVKPDFFPDEPFVLVIGAKPTQTVAPR